MPDKRLETNIFVWPALLAAAAGAALLCDIAVAQWAVAGGCPKEIKKLLDICESFAHGYGVLIILISVAVLDVSSRVQMPRLLLATLGVGGAANVVKLLIERTRPHHFDFEGTVVTTFGDLLPLFSSPSSQQSFPSTHTVTAVALATALSFRYPQGRYLFLTLAALAGCQRIAARAHYPSDVLAGAAIGCLLAALVMRTRWFDSWEAEWSARKAA